MDVDQRSQELYESLGEPEAEKRHYAVLLVDEVVNSYCSGDSIIRYWAEELYIDKRYEGAYEKRYHMTIVEANEFLKEQGPVVWEFREQWQDALVETALRIYGAHLDEYV